MRIPTFLPGLALAASLAATALAADMPGVPGMKAEDHAAATAPASQPAAQSTDVDLGNTKCAVTGDVVGDSKLTASYEGKIYHFCCEDCPVAFKKDPARYAKAVAADPAKYGVPSAKTAK
jgi:YHS domain-containing protein